ncbi:translation elongation factor Ts [Oleidesulfovibrio alaskensis G20]|jgi:elongation factor Ts|uniref:Elongation factor Ts n=1 Tax=Oleidesulfovibrio alaskensis (strain ATCC BAA-1058 / DSM 17464 / G20) TaxID=207559 RepID=EFTS_OLEA2|nr:translation elongation factor Ts [Oleidesulfovibrio alaskensis]Q313G3.1 RecName: Full=Elongation factor Ts; Short=EF-Ts [Oleidesulfovibrio alaskensis G20]ABB37933.1 translation elongation factor Ts [Oleidesulfovibrio alaskensis G20]MBG0772915.1 translation elongation factor Ts [Oleidesulfovibrio alaskensis]MBL3582529.1 translation elongation factor Ts [Oleidesulfovibrio alaskensis]
MAAITAAMVKELREKTAAGMMDCKKALQECDGDEAKAVDWLRQKGLSKAAKKADRATSEGLIGSYIHSNGKIGVMVELKCETDFVARNEQFIELAKNLAMQIAATNPVAVDENGVDAELIERERAVYREKALAEGKPENIVEKIVDGAIKKYYKEVCLLEQPFIRDDKKVIRDLLNDTIATLGENITVGRFCRFQLGA